MKRPKLSDADFGILMTWARADAGPELAGLDEESTIAALATVLDVAQAEGLLTIERTASELILVRTKGDGSIETVRLPRQLPKRR